MVPEAEGIGQRSGVDGSGRDQTRRNSTPPGSNWQRWGDIGVNFCGSDLVGGEDL